MSHIEGPFDVLCHHSLEVDLCMLASVCLNSIEIEACANTDECDKKGSEHKLLLLAQEE